MKWHMNGNKVCDGSMKKKNFVSFSAFTSIITVVFIILTKNSVFHQYGAMTFQKRNAENIIFLFLERSDFSCQLCLSSFLQLCDTLQNKKFNHIVIRGILEGSGIDNNKEKVKHDKILKKQIRGFIKGNNLQFPFFLDSAQVFRKIKDKDTAVIVLNNSLSMIRQWTAPLSRDDICEICSFSLIH